VSSASEALTALLSNRPDVIITDIAMPEIDGYAFMRRLGETPGRSIPVIALSAFPRRTVEGSHLFSDYLAKPVEPEDLITAVKRSSRRQKVAR
jgi:CheY-like chemotaxis protein